MLYIRSIMAAHTNRDQEAPFTTDWNKCYFEFWVFGKPLETTLLLFDQAQAKFQGFERGNGDFSSKIEIL